MSHYETLMARDSHAFGAYIANPAAHARGAVIIVHELFGLTEHIRRVTDSYAADGYLVVAPALFDRVRRDLVLGDSREEIERALGYCKQIDSAKSVLDIAACVATVRHAGKVAMIGYGWGGSLAWLAAAEVSLVGVVCYYGTAIAEYLAKTPGCAAMLHFGEHDTLIPLSAVERIRAAFPQGLFYLYAADHGFENDSRPQCYAPAAAALARSRTLGFLAQQIGQTSMQAR